MKQKLLSKRSDGMRDWDSPAYRSLLVQRLLLHVAQGMEDGKQWVDVANFAAFLWWMDTGQDLGEETQARFLKDIGLARAALEKARYAD